MIDKTDGVWKVSNQSFSKNGVRLSELRENKVLFEFFKKAGISENGFVFESDIEKLKQAYDENSNGKLSQKEAREIFGLDISRKELRQVLKDLNKIENSSLESSKWLIQTKVDDNTTNYFDTGGKLVKRLETGENGTRIETAFLDGDENKVYLENYTSDGKFESRLYKDGDKSKPLEIYSNDNGNESKIVNDYNDDGLLVSQDKYENGQHIKSKYIYTNGNQLDHIITTANGKKTTYIYAGNSEKLGPKRIVEEDGDFIKSIENEYVNGKLASQTIEGGRDLAKGQISRQVLEYDETGSKLVKTVSENMDGTKVSVNHETGIQVTSYPAEQVNDTKTVSKEAKDKVAQDNNQKVAPQPQDNPVQGVKQDKKDSEKSDQPPTAVPTSPSADDKKSVQTPEQGKKDNKDATGPKGPLRLPEEKSKYLEGSFEERMGLNKGGYPFPGLKGLKKSSEESKASETKDKQGAKPSPTKEQPVQSAQTPEQGKKDDKDATAPKGPLRMPEEKSKYLEGSFEERMGLDKGGYPFPGIKGLKKDSEESKASETKAKQESKPSPTKEQPVQNAQTPEQGKKVDKDATTPKGPLRMPEEKSKYLEGSFEERMGLNKEGYQFPGIKNLKKAPEKTKASETKEKAKSKATTKKTKTAPKAQSTAPKPKFLEGSFEERMGLDKPKYELPGLKAIKKQSPKAKTTKTNKTTSKKVPKKTVNTSNNAPKGPLKLNNESPNPFLQGNFSDRMGLDKKW